MKKKTHEGALSNYELALRRYAFFLTDDMTDDEIEETLKAFGMDSKGILDRSMPLIEEKLSGLRHDYLRDIQNGREQALERFSVAETSMPNDRGGIVKLLEELQARLFGSQRNAMVFGRNLESSSVEDLKRKLIELRYLEAEKKSHT